MRAAASRASNLKNMAVRYTFPFSAIVGQERMKLALCLNAVQPLIGGVLILPTRSMYRYLTDRVGNYAELEPYFPIWRAIPVEEGLLAVFAIEHDAVSRSVARIPKGTDGRALQ